MYKTIILCILTSTTSVFAGGMGPPHPGDSTIAGENPSLTTFLECLLHDDVYETLEVWNTMPMCSLAAQGIVYGTASYSQHRLLKHEPHDPECFRSQLVSR